MLTTYLDNIDQIDLYLNKYLKSAQAFAVENLLSLDFSISHTLCLRQPNFYRYNYAMQMKLTPKIKVHCWGGLGSQLYAWALVEDLRLKFHKREIVLILHENGVTKRRSEISKFFLVSEVRQIQDFIEPHMVDSNDIEYSSLRINCIKKVIKILSTNFGLLSYCNTDDEFIKLKPWVLSIRGNYYNRTLSNESIRQIHNKFKANGFLIKKQNRESCIHYRLGDLLTMSNKKPNEISRVFQALKILELYSANETLHIFSDSPEIALENLSKYAGALQFKSYRSEILDTFFRLIESKNFLGTSSKISEWVLIFRLYLQINGLSIVTKEIFNHVNKSCNLRLKTEYIRTY